MDRKARIEEKRKALALLREEREKNKKERESRLASAPVSKFDTDGLLKSLGISTTETSKFTTLEDNCKPITKPQETKLKPIQKKDKLKRLTVSTFFQTITEPKEDITYNKQTQTLQSSFEKDENGHCPSSSNLEWDDEFNIEDSLPSSMETPPSIFGNATDPIPSPKEKVRPRVNLTEEDKKKIMQSGDFVKFVNNAAALMDKEFKINFDIFDDYSCNFEEIQLEDKQGLELELSCCLEDETWSKNRTVTSFDWSSQFPERLVASYNCKEEFTHDPDGVCLIWNMKFKKTQPEYIFHCQSPVMSVCFAKFHPNLVIGGTYSGQLVIWDSRVNKRTPIQRSPLSNVGHTHPIYCVEVVGTQNSHNLISISTDGKLCSWSLDMLSKPQDSFELLQQKQSRSIAATCLAFSSDDDANFLVGSEESCVYYGSRQGRSGITKSFEGHQAPITSVANHPSLNFSHLFLSSSLDWTVKLWSVDEPKHLLSFENNSDYMFDVAWSPIHPALFTCIDATGRLDLWNLNLDTELPTVSLQVEGSPALNQVAWTPSGHQVVVGDELGKIWMYDVGEQLIETSNNEWVRFQQTLDYIKKDRSDSFIPLS